MLNALQRRDAFDGLREAHEASGLYNKRLKFQDPPPASSNDSPPTGSASSRSLTVSSHPICLVQRRPETQSYHRLNRDYYDPSLRIGMSGYPNASQDYEGYESDECSTDEYEPEDQVHYSALGMGPTRMAYNPETGELPNYSASNSRKIGISDLLCSETSAPRGTTRSHQTVPPRPYETYGNSSAKSVNGLTTLTSPHDGYAPYETRETTQKTSTHDSDAAQSPASTDVRLRNASHIPHEANKSLSRTSTPEPPQDSMYNYASYPSSPITSTYLPHYDHYRLSSPEPNNRIRLPSPPYNDRASLQHSRSCTSYDGSTRFQTQEKNGHKRPLNSRSRSPRRSRHGFSHAALDWDKPSDYHFQPPVELSGSGFNCSSRPTHDSAIGMVLTVERRPPIPISKDFRPPNYRPNHLFRVLRRGPPQDDEPLHPMSVDDPSPIEDDATARCSSPAPSSPATIWNSEPPNRSPGSIPPPRSPSPPVTASQVSQPSLPPQQLASAPIMTSAQPLSNASTPGGIFSHYRPKLTQGATCETADTTTGTTTATTYYRPHCVINTTTLPVTASAVVEAEKVDHLEGTDSSAKATELLAKKAKQRKTTKRTPGEFSCGFCEKTFTRNFDMLRHQKTIHQNPQPVVVGAQTCPDCNNYFNRKDAYARHLEKRPGSCFKALNLRASAHLKAQAPESVQAILKKGKAS